MAKTIGDRIQQRMDELEAVGEKVTAADLATAADVSPQSVYMLLDGTTKTAKASNLLAYARRLRCRPEWLQHGKGPKTADENVTDAPSLRGRVPVISWTTAGRWGDVADPLPPGEGEVWLPTTRSVGPNAFALRIVGDSMEPGIPDGSTVIIDPARQYKHGSIVLAKRTQDQQATLKQLIYEGDHPRWLKPLNDRYPPIEMPEDTRIIGVMVWSGRDWD